MNLPNYIKEKIDQEIDSLLFEENKEYIDYESQKNSLNNLNKIIDELRNQNIGNTIFTLSKLTNNKIIKSSNLQILEGNQLSQIFKNKTLDEKIQILQTLYSQELEKFNKLKKPNEKIKKSENEIKKIIRINISRSYRCVIICRMLKV